MIDFTNLMNALAKFANTDDEKKTVKTYDLTTEEGLKGFNEQLDTLEEADLELLNLFGINSKDWIKGMRDIGKKIYDNANKEVEEKKQPKQIERKEIDHTIGKEFKRPSELLTVDQKLQLHKIVQEYVDKMIKPYNNGLLSTNQINDAYAGLYEFGAWVLKR